MIMHGTPDFKIFWLVNALLFFLLVGDEREGEETNK